MTVDVNMREKKIHVKRKWDKLELVVNSGDLLSTTLRERNHSNPFIRLGVIATIQPLTGFLLRECLRFFFCFLSALIVLEHNRK